MYDQDVFELLQAIDAWRRKNDRQFPAWSEVLTILKALGWRKVAAADVAEGAAAKRVEPVKPVEPMATAKLLPSGEVKKV
ncbi:MAG TPA: hypothetical protein VFG37_00980 [Planctomycetota bacterium]|nr:hypothetical protein [Planctomycetota bacterium]